MFSQHSDRTFQNSTVQRGYNICYNNKATTINLSIVIKVKGVLDKNLQCSMGHTHVGCFYVVELYRLIV